MFSMECAREKSRENIILVSKKTMGDQWRSQTTCLEVKKTMQDIPDTSED